MRARAATAAALAVLAGLAATLPSTGGSAPLETREIGLTLNGRAITAYRLGDPAAARKVLIVGSIHGDEPAGVRIASVLQDDFAEASVDLWVVPTTNPDGLSSHRRGNARSVDLNRNWGYRWRKGPRDGYYPGAAPFSEPETRAMRDFIAEIKPELSIWFHQPWDAVLAPCRGPRPLQKRYAKLTGMKTSCRGDKLRGTAISWQKANFPGSTNVVVELGAGKPSAAKSRRHADAVAAVAAPAAP